MQARMNHPVAVLPDAMKALFALKASTERSGLPHNTVHLAELRASQINGCCACVDMHSRDAKKAGETDDRLFAVVAWRESPLFDPAERAALGLAEAMTRIADRSEGVPDAVWEEAARHYDESALAALVLAIANINVWNRLNVAIRQPAGEWKG